MADPTSTVIASGASSTATTTATFSAVSSGTLLTLHVSSDDYRLTTGTNRPESSGWTLLQSGQDFLGAYVWYKSAAGGETSVSYAIGSAVSSAYVVLAHTDIVATSPLEVSAVTHSHGGAGGGVFTTSAPSAGATTSGRRYAIASMHAMQASTSITGASGWTNGFVEVADRAGPTTGSREIVAVAGLAFDGGGAGATTAATWAGASQLCSFGVAAVFKVAATGGGSIAGAGAATGSAATADGDGTVSLTGSGTTSGPAATASGAGGVRLAGSGSATAPEGVADSDGTLTATGAGSATAPTGQASGAGTVTTPGGNTGQATAPAGAASGSGSVSLAGSGAATAPNSTADGDGAVRMSGAGSATSPAGTASSSGSLAASGVGTATAPAATAHGSGATGDVVIAGPVSAGAPHGTTYTAGTPTTTLDAGTPRALTHTAGRPT